MCEKRRVLFCCEHYPPSVGGVQEVVRQIAERFCADGIDVTVATSSHPDRSEEVVRQGVRVISFPIHGNRVNGMHGPVEKYQEFLKNGQFEAILIKAAQQWTFDAALGVLHSIPARKLFIPCGFSGLHEPRYAEYFQEMPNWLRLFDGLIFYAHEYQDIHFARQHGLTHLHFIPNGVDEREFLDLDDHQIRERLGIGLDHSLVLSVGSQIAAKGHWEVVRAFGRARLHQPATLVINANQPGSAWLTRFKRSVKHALKGRWPLSWLVKWYGRDPNWKKILVVDLPRQALVDLYKASNLFVFASHVEYSPLVLFEAAAAGTPFLTSSAGNSKEIACWTGGGVVMPRTFHKTAEMPVAALAHQMGEMLDSPSQMLALGQVARANILNRGLTWDKIALQYRELMLGQGTTTASEIASTPACAWPM